MDNAVYDILYNSVPSEFLDIARLVPLTRFNGLCGKFLSARPVSRLGGASNDSVAPMQRLHIQRGKLSPSLHCVVCKQVHL